MSGATFARYLAAEVIRDRPTQDAVVAHLATSTGGRMNYVEHLRQALAQLRAARARWSARLVELENSLLGAERDMSTAACHCGALQREIGHLEAVLFALEDGTPMPAACLWCGHEHQNAQAGSMNIPAANALEPGRIQRCVGCADCGLA